jgi:hypothetical protein
MRIGFALSPKCVKTSHLDDGAVTTEKIASDAVTTEKIGLRAVTTDKIGSSAVTEVKIASNAVTVGKIGSSAVTTEKIGAGAVTEAKIASNAVTLSKIASSSVSRSILKTSVASSQFSSQGVHFYLMGGGDYGFHKQQYQTGGMQYVLNDWAQGQQGPTSYTTAAAVNIISGTGYVHVRQRYITDSGEVFWIYILRDIATKKIIAIWQCPDHPCFGNGGDPIKTPHPFLSFIPNEQEIIVCNPSINEVQHMRSICGDRDLTDVIRDDYIIDERSNPVWTEKEITVGLPGNHDWSMGEITPLKRRIPKPDMIIHKSLIRKNV